VSPEVALRIVLDVLEALDAVRGQWRDLFPSVESDDDRLLASAVHGGLTPDGVLVASFGEAMLLDAGLAGVAMTMHPILDHADVIGYRAPEQIEPGGPADERADVFTTGVLVWEILAGRPLFAPAMMPRPATTGQAVKTKTFSDAMQVSTVRRKVLTSPIQRLDALPLLRGRVTKAYADVVAKCLEREPAKRFQTVRELIGAFAELGPRAVAGYDAVSRLLASVGAAPIDETPVDVTSGRSTSNRPTVPPEKADAADSSPPDTKRATPASSAAATAPVAVDPTSAQTTSGTAPEEEKPAGPVEEAEMSLSVDDLQSIPPAANADSIPAATDVESLPPSADERLTAPAVAPLSSAVSVEVDSVKSAEAPGPIVAPTTDPSPFVSALELPRLAPPAAAEETTSAPVVRPVEREGGLDLASTMMSSQSAGAKNRKIVVGVVAAAGVLALVGIVRVLTSGHGNEPDPPSASAATSAAPAPVTEPSLSAVPPEVPESPTAGEPPLEAPRGESAPPTKAAPPTLAPSPAGNPQSIPQKRPLPPKKKPFRPSGI
jgi:serine/threonine-protein kinase